MNEAFPFWKRLFRWGLALAAWGFFAISLLCFLCVALIIHNGGTWAYIIYASKPIHNLLGGLGALFAWYVLLYGIHNTAQDWKRFAGRVILSAFGLAFSLAAGEIALRAFYSARQEANSMDRLKVLRREGKPVKVNSTHPLAVIVQPSENPKVVYELQPNLDMEFGHRRVRTNSQGMRSSREYSVAKSAGTIRIVGIGDSGMFGWDQHEQDSYLSVLETNLNSRGKGVLYEVLNLAVPGYNTQLEVETLKAKGLAYKPDIVVVGWCENDFSLPMFLLEKEKYWRGDTSFLYNLLFKRSRATKVGAGLILRDLREYNKDNVMPELTTGTDISGVKKALTELRQLGEQEGFKVLVFGPMKPLIRRICEQVGVPYASTYDLIPDYTYPKSYLVFFMHPSRDGHRVLGQLLEEELNRRDWLSPAGRKSSTP